MSSPIGWYIGVGLGVGSSIVSNVGVNIQKLAHSKRDAEVQESVAENFRLNGGKNIERRDTETDRHIRELETTIKKQQKSYLLDWKWVLGLILQIVGAMMDFSALSVAPASVVAPLGSLTLVTNVCLAPIMHNEKLSNITIIATSLIIFGTITTVIFSPRTVSVKTTQEVFALFHTTAFWVYAIPTCVLLLITFIITKYMTFLKLKGNKKYGPNYYKLHRFSIATLSGTMGAQNVFFAKCVSTLLLFTIEGKGNMFIILASYLIIVGLLTTIYFQLKWLNAGLQNFSALHIVPVFQSFWITVSVIGGLIVYHEFDAMRMIDKIIFPIGVIVTIFGVALLTSQQKPKARHTKKINSLSSHDKSGSDGSSNPSNGSNTSNSNTNHTQKIHTNGPNTQNKQTQIEIEMK